MLNNKGFDLWADGYDKCVGLSDEDGTYPFAGYKQILNEIYNRVLAGKGNKILDIGFGTGILASKLYEQGFRIWGQDFSERMIELAKEKMPKAELYQGDFTGGLVKELEQNRYDAVIATYSLHHLTEEQKISLIKKLLTILDDDGCIYIGDVAFETRAQHDSCRVLAGDEWDDEEIYPVAEEWKSLFPRIEFERFSFCSGLFSLKRYLP